MSTLFNKGHALVIGVGADLPNTVDDAVGLADIFRDSERCAYPPDQVQLLMAEAATRAAILDGLDRLAQVETDATVVVYFSGHGYEVASTLGKFYYLMPHGYDINQLHATAVSGQELATRLAAIPAQKLLLLLDCCHAGGLDLVRAPAGVQMSKAPLPPEATMLLARGDGRAVIASSRADELSYAGKPYSAFTLALIEALAGRGASQKDGYVRLTDLALHTRQMVPQRTQHRQHPILNFQQADNFVVAYYAGGDSEPKGLPFSVEPEIEPEPGAFNRQAPSYHANVQGGGAIVQGPGATAVGERGVHVGGSVGGSIVTGDSNTVTHTGGDYVGGDKIGGDKVGGDKITVGDITNSTAAIGRDARANRGVSGAELAALFKTVYREIEVRPPDPDVDREEIQETVQKIEAETTTDDPNEKKLTRWMDSLLEMAPDIFEVIVASLRGPVAGGAAVLRKVADKARKGGKRRDKDGR